MTSDNSCPRKLNWRGDDRKTKKFPRVVKRLEWSPTTRSAYSSSREETAERLSIELLYLQPGRREGCGHLKGDKYNVFVILFSVSMGSVFS